MSKLSIKLQIADRAYPLTINREEEESMRRAAKLVNKNIVELEKNFAVRDKQDLLAMAALQFAAKSEGEKTGTIDDPVILAEIESIKESLIESLK